MPIQDIIVNIRDATRGIAQKGFNLVLLLSTEMAQEYKVYIEAAEVAEDFGADSKTAKAAQSFFAQDPTPGSLAVLGIVRDPDAPSCDELSVALNSLMESHNDWFYLMCTSHEDVTNDVKTLSDWTAANGKFYVATNDNADTVADIIARLGTLQSENTVFFSHKKPETYPDAGLLGRMSTYYPGAANWNFKTLNLIEPSGYTSSEILELEAAKAICYMEKRGINVTTAGWTTSGAYADIVLGKAKLKARVEEEIFSTMVNTDKITYDDPGIALVVSTLDKALRTEAKPENGIIAWSGSQPGEGKPLYSISAPSRADISKTDIANRKLPNVNWNATIAGAVDIVEVNGVLQL